MDRLTNLILCLDPTDGQVEEERTSEGIWNKRYRIMLPIVAALTPECAKDTSILCYETWNSGQGRTLRTI